MYPLLSDIKITAIKDPWDFLPLTPWMELSGEPVGMSKAEMLARVLLKKYIVLVAMDEEKVYGCAIIEPMGTVCNVIYTAVRPPGLFKKLLKRFKEDMKAHGYKKIRGWTRIDPKVYERLTGMKVAWTCFEENLE